MYLPLVTFENLHDILGELHDDMIGMCGGLIGVSMAIGGIAALLYITYRVWQSIARAEPIDVFPLLRPFAIGLCILLFHPLVLRGIDGIMRPLVNGTHAIFASQTFQMNRFQEDKDRLERENLARGEMAYIVDDEEYDRQLAELGWDPEDLNTMESMYEDRVGFGIKSWLVSGVRWVLELLFKAASLVIDTVRTFFLIVLAILGPVVFALSIFDGFQNSLVTWLGKYISVYLWLPIADLFGAVLCRLQILSLQKDMELMASDPLYMFDSSNIIYLLFMIIGIVGYFCVPSVANWVVQTNGLGSYNRMVTVVGNRIVYGAGATAGVLWSRTQAMFGRENNTVHAAPRPTEAEPVKTSKN